MEVLECIVELFSKKNAQGKIRFSTPGGRIEGRVYSKLLDLFYEYTLDTFTKPSKH